MKKFMLFPVLLILMNIHAWGGQEHLSGNIPRREATELKKGQILLVRNSFGVAAIEFTEFRESEAQYRWKYLDRETKKESVGEGNVFENYEETWTSETEVKITDKGSQLWIQAGPFSIEWSYCSTDCGWLYLDSKKLNFVVLEKANFDSVDLYIYN